MDHIFNDTKDDNEKIRFIISQTNYTQEYAKEKLMVHNGDSIKVIKEYMGVPINPANKHIKSINQEIYKQIRNKLDTNMREYNKKNHINTQDVISKFQQYKEI